MNNKNFYIVTVILLISGFISFFSYMPTRFGVSADIKMSDFPKTIGEWASEDTPLSEREYELLETKNLIMRNYKNQKGDIVNLYIIYSQNNRKVSLPPEISLQGQGETITYKEPLQIKDSIKATKLIIERDTSRELVVYWYKAGKLNTDSYLKQQIKVVIDRMRGKDISVALIRLLTEMKDEKEGVGLKRIKTFYALIEPLLEKYLP